MSSELNLSAMDDLKDAAECLKVMAHPVRLRLVEILMQDKLPVKDIARLCELPSHQMSEHLRLLHGRGLLSSERQGRTVYYQVDDERLPALVNCVRSACHTVKKSP